MTDSEYMERAIALAKEATGHTSPNPLVGAVIVKDGQIIGEGYHHKAGEPHAEVHALHQAGMEARGATLYVTLEPCSHYGKTPPCAKRVIAAGLKRVVIGMVDPNPLVSGKGIQLLKDAGIEVTVGVLEEACQLMNEDFITFIAEKRPFVVLKSAMSLDGKIATATGESKWITSRAAREDGHELRAKYDAMLVGIGTILADDPQLNCRIYDRKIKQPDVYILDAFGRTPMSAKVWQTEGRTVYIIVSQQCDMEKIMDLERKGAEVIILPETDGHIDLEAVLEEMGARNCMSVLVEGGSRILASFVEQNLFDKYIAYIGNILIGGVNATPALGGSGLRHLRDAAPLHFASTTVLDEAIKIVAYREKGRA